MKKILLSLVLLIPMLFAGVLSPVQAAADEEEVLEIRLVKVIGAPLKAGASKSAATIRTLKQGEALKLTETVIAGWRKVQLDAYTYAYVNNSFLEQVAGYTVDIPANGKMRLAAKDTAFKTEPSKVNTSFKKNEIIVQRSATAASVLIETLSGHKGYVPSNSFVTLEPTIRKVNLKDGIVVRENPSPKAKVMYTLFPNTAVESYGQVPGGWRVIFHRTKVGYVAAEPMVAAKAEKRWINAANVEVRSVDSKSVDAVTDVLYYGVEVSAYPSSNGWSYIQNGSVTGYVPTSQLTAKKPTR